MKSWKAIALLTSGLVGVVALPSAGHAHHDTLKGSFEAIALPARSPSVWGVDGACLHRNGVDQASERFVAPFDGLLSVEVEASVSGWNVGVLEVTDPQSHYKIAGGRDGFHGVPVKKGQHLEIYACNFQGAPIATVSYELTHRRLNEPAPAETRVERTEEGFYNVLPGTVFPVRHEFACLGGCFEFEIAPMFRYITEVRFDDSVARDVALIVYQHATSRNGYREDYFCSSHIDEPIELIPGADWVGASAALGPCQNGTPTTATGGTVSITVSSLP